MKTQLMLMISEIYDIRPSESKKVIEYLDNNITEIINAAELIASDTQKENFAN